MRKTLGFVLLGLAGFLVTTALLTLIYVPGQVKKTPLDVNSDTQLTGRAAYLSEPMTDVRYLSRTVADGTASDGDVVVFDNLTCLWRAAPDSTGSCPGDDETTISIATDRFATDRVTALAVNDEAYVGAGAEPKDGLINKFPFGVAQKSYQVWDGLLGRAVEAKFDGEEEINGLNTYKFLIEFTDEPAEISEGISGTFSDTKRLWIDPVTGSIIDQSEQQKRVLDSGDNALDLDVSFTDAQVQANVDAAKESGGLLRTLGLVPWIAFGLAALAALGGIFLVRGASSGSTDGSEDVSLDEMTAQQPALTTRRSAGLPPHPGWQASVVHGAVGPGRVATTMSVPGSSAPRSGDQPPHTEALCSGHSGSTTSVSTSPAATTCRTRSPRVRWCSA
jgi:hypothetical protein